MRILFLAGLALSAIGCASTPMTAQQCDAIDWGAKGYSAGVAGSTSGAPAAPADCAALGIAPNYAAFDAGYAEGIKTYCAPENGYAVGAAGRAYGGQCASLGDREFLVAYGEGKTMYGFTHAVSSARSRAASAERDFEIAQRKLAEYQDALNYGSFVTPEEQQKAAKMQRKADGLRRDLPRLRQEITRAYREVDAAERTLASYEARLDRKSYAATAAGAAAVAATPVNVTVNVNNTNAGGDVTNEAPRP